MVTCHLSIFVCHLSRAVHIELLADTTSAAFFDCLMKFSARQEVPEAIYCDQATNFFGCFKFVKDSKVYCLKFCMGKC
jgi:hypothetical protein